MKVLITTLLIVLAFGALPALAVSGDTLKVPINKEKRLPRTTLSIRFVELIEDSRCPVDTNCIWAGNAKIKVRVRRGSGPARVFEMDTNGPNNSISHGGYRITLTDLAPHPRSNIRINRNGYVAEFKADLSPK